MDKRECYAYLRVSSNGQAQADRDGLPRQLAAVEQYAAANGLHIAQVWTDAISGTSDAGDRPSFMDMLDKAELTGVSVVLVENLTRIARDLLVQETILGDLQRREIELVSTQEPDLNSTDPTRILLRQFIGAISQYERAMIVNKLKVARQRAKASRPDYREGKRPFGELPGEQETISRMKELKREGCTLRLIADTLNKEGRKARAGRWHAATILRILGRD